MALITALVTALVLLSLAISFLYFLERDYRFAGLQEKEQRAYYLARAGLRFQATRTDLLYAAPGGTHITLALPPGSLTDFVDVSVDPTGAITSRGYVKTLAGTLEAQRTLQVAAGNPIRLFQDSSL